MEILSYPVGLLVGVIQITVAFSAGENGGSLLLNGERVCDLTPSQNSCQVALGAVPKLHRLDLASETPQGLVVNDTRWLNRGVLPAELRLVKTTNGKRCEMFLVYAHPNKEKAIRLLVTSDREVLFDGPPRHSLSLNCEGSVFVAAEVAFADGLRASSVLPLSQFSENASVAVYPWHLEAVESEEQRALALGESAPFAVERGEAHLLVVAEPFSLAKLLDLAGVQEAPAGDWELRERTASFRAVRQLRFSGPLSEPVAITLILAVEGFPRVEIPRSRDWLQRLLLASEELSQRFAKRPRRLWDATALAGYLASSVSRRRVVWAISSTVGEDASRFASASVRRYLMELNVPLVHWIIATKSSEDVAVTKIWSQDDLAPAFAALDRVLGNQVVLWLTRDPLAEPVPELPAGYRRAGDYRYAGSSKPRPEADQASGGEVPKPLTRLGSLGRSLAANARKGEMLRLPIPPGFANKVTSGADEAVFQAEGAEPARLPVEAEPGSAPVFVFIHPAFVTAESLPYWKQQVSELAFALAPHSPILLLPRQVGFGLEPVQLVGPEALNTHWSQLTRVFEAMLGLAGRRAGYLEPLTRNNAPMYRQAKMALAASRGQEERSTLLAALASLVDWADNHPGPAWLLVFVDDLPMDPCGLVATLMSQVTGEPLPAAQNCGLSEELRQLAAFLSFRGYSVLGVWQTLRKPEARFLFGAGLEGSVSPTTTTTVSLAGGDQEFLKLLALYTGGSSAKDRFQWQFEANGKHLWALLQTEKIGGLSGQGSRLSLGSISWAIRRERPEFWVIGPLQAYARGGTVSGDLLDDIAVTRREPRDGSTTLGIRLHLRQGKEEPPRGPVRLSVGTWAQSGPVRWQQRMLETPPDEFLIFETNVAPDALWLGVVVEDLESGRWGGASVPVESP